MKTSLWVRPSIFAHFFSFFLTLSFFLWGNLYAAGETPLPPNPKDWACEIHEPPQKLIEQWCKSNLDRGLSSTLQAPGSLLDLDAKNAFDLALTDFVMQKKYVDYGWLHDQRWRMTGPYVGKPNSTNGKNYGVHPAVKIYYSPEIIDWMCTGRKDGEIPDGAMIIKEMHEIDEQLELKVAEDGCMDITADQTKLDESFSSWTIMVKDSRASKDGWYWANPYKTSTTYGNPPLLDRSAFPLESSVPDQPTEPDPRWVPTGNMGSTHAVNYPYNGFGVVCLNCHVSAKAESTFSSLENLMGEGLRYKGYDLEDGEDKKSTTYISPFHSPLTSADPEFLKEFNQLHEVPFARAWELRMPAQTYDHVVAPADGKQTFLTSDQCIACHDATYSNSEKPNMMYEKQNGDLVNLSVYGEWSVSPMGLAGRDPIFFSQLQSETNNLPELAACIENTCLRCHGVMGQRQFSRDTEGDPGGRQCDELIYPVPPDKGQVPEGKAYPLATLWNWQDKDYSGNAKYAALSRDGISCMACHQMEEDPGTIQGPNDATNQKNLVNSEKYFTGNFVTAREPVIYGPVADDEISTKPMEHYMGITPKFGKQIKQSETCGNCHNILLPEVSNEGKVLGGSYEQTTHLEWVNSVFSQPDSGWFKSCQDCHMPHSYEGDKLNFKIANIESSDFAPTTERLPDNEIEIKEVENFSRHSLHGLNIFLNQMFQQFPVLLGKQQIDYMTGKGVEPSLITGQKSMLEMARKETATVTINDLKKKKDHLLATVTVTNHAGHYLPSGVGFRRAFIEFLVLDKHGKPLWASGRTNSLGQILNGTGNTPLLTELPLQNPKQWQPHYLKIDHGNQVQIYQEIILDSAGDVTTSFLRRVKHVKDNRLRPKGFDPKFFKKSDSKFIRKLAKREGKNVKKDPFYSNPKLTGADQIQYKVNLSPELMKQVDRIQVTLYNQSIPPGYLQQRFRDANRGPAEKDQIQRLYYLTSHMDVNSPVDENGKPFIKDWKMQIGESAVLSVSGEN